MPIGTNVTIKDRLIKKTSNRNSGASIANKENIASNASTAINGKSKNATENTKKATFYMNPELLRKLYNFAYWDRHSITEAMNIILADGLTGKNTKDKDN